MARRRLSIGGFVPLQATRDQAASDRDCPSQQEGGSQMVEEDGFRVEEQMLGETVDSFLASTCIFRVAHRMADDVILVDLRPAANKERRDNDC